MDQILEGIDGGLILMLVVYSGLASWVVARLTRSVSDATATTRQALAESLELLERLERARVLVNDPSRRKDLEVMYARIETEVAERVDELNGVAQLLHDRPSAQFVVLPRPRRLLGAVWSLLLIIGCYTGGALLTNFMRQFLIERSVSLSDAGGLELMLLQVGGGVGLISIGLIFRMLAYRDYDAHVERLRQKGRKDEQAA